MVKRFAEYTFACKRSHITKDWQWNSVQKIRCLSKGCRLNAYRLLHTSTKTSSEPTIYYKLSNGEVFIPADPNHPRIPKGATRCEIRTFRDRDRFYKEANLADSIEAEQLKEGEEMVFGEYRRQERSDLLHEMKSMSPFGRDVAKAAMNKNDSAPRSRYESRSYLVGWEFDSSNR